MGTMNCPKKSILVTNKDECERSAAVFGKQFKREDCLETEIAGCHDNGPYIYFSNCAKGHTRQNHAAVCKS